MYKRHKLMIPVVFLISVMLAYILKLDYNNIAELAMTVVAIAIAAYISVATVILGSNYSKFLSHQINPEDKTQTQLGVLASYLRNAGKCSVATIVMSCAYQFPAIIPNETLLRVSSAFSCAVFFINLVFTWLILAFIINALTKATNT